MEWPEIAVLNLYSEFFSLCLQNNLIDMHIWTQVFNVNFILFTQPSFFLIGGGGVGEGLGTEWLEQG